MGAPASSSSERALCFCKPAPKSLITACTRPPSDQMPIINFWCRVSTEDAPDKALRSLVFLVTTIRELGYAVAKTGGEAPLEASVLEAAFQV